MPDNSDNLARYHQRLHRVINYINANLDEALDLDTLAEVACLSRFHWHRIYQPYAGDYSCHGKALEAQSRHSTAERRGKPPRRKTCAQISAFPGWKGHNMPVKVDLKKQHKDIYAPSPKKISTLNLGPVNYLMIDSKGAPDSPAYASAVAAIFAVSYTMKIITKREQAHLIAGLCRWKGCGGLMTWCISPASATSAYGRER